MKDRKGNQSTAKRGQRSARGSQIGHQKSAPGKRPVKFHSSFLKIMTGSDLSQRRIPYMRAEGHRKGPVVWLTACCHGDEVGGIVVVQEVFKRIRKIHLQRGTIHAFPLMNPLGFETGSRRILMSNEDLNRSFPGNPTGTLAERLADKVFQSILKTGPAVVIDLHNDWIRSIPYAVVDPLAEMTAGIADQVRTLAVASGLPVVLEQNALRHSLSHSLIQSGFPALTLELGESFVVNETNVDIGMKTIFRLLRVLQMIGGDDDDNRNLAVRRPFAELQSASQ